MDFLLSSILSLFEGPLGAVFMFLGGILAFTSGAWLVLKSFLVNWKLGLISLLVPFAYIFIGFRNERLRRVAFTHTAAVIYTIGMLMVRSLIRVFFETPVPLS